MDKELILFLKDFVLFKGLTDVELESLCKNGKILEKESGEIIFKEQDEGEDIYIILEGEVEISQSLVAQVPESDIYIKDKILTKLFAAQKIFFGEAALLTLNKRMATVITCSNCKFLVLNKKNIEEVLKSNYNLGYRFMKNVAEVLALKLKKSNEDVTKLSMALMLALKE